MKRSAFSLLLLLALTLGIFSACNTPRYYTYAPAPPVAPFFKQKGDSKISAYVSAASAVIQPGADLQAAYALSDHVALTGSYSSRRERNRYDSYEDGDSITLRYGRRIGDIGIGYFTALNERKTVTFNVYAGYGMGRFKMTEDGAAFNSGNRTLYKRYHNADIKKGYIQPSIHFMPGNVFRIGLVSRVSLVQYDKIKTDYSAQELSDRTLSRMQGNSYVYVEPTINMQFAFPAPWIKLDMGITFCPDFIFDEYDDYTQRRTRNVSASIGLTFDLAKIKRVKK